MIAVRRISFRKHIKATLQNYFDFARVFLFDFPIAYENDDRKTLGIVTCEGPKREYKFRSEEELRSLADESLKTSKEKFGETGQINIWESQLAKLERKKQSLMLYPELQKTFPIFHAYARRGIIFPKPAQSQNQRALQA